MGNKLQWCMYTNNNFAFKAVAKKKAEKEHKKRKGMCDKRVWVLAISLPNSTVSLETSRLRSMFAIESMVLVSRKAHRGSENGFVFNPCCRLSTYSICKKNRNKKVRKKVLAIIEEKHEKKMCASCKLKRWQQLQHDSCSDCKHMHYGRLKWSTKHDSYSGCNMIATLFATW